MIRLLYITIYFTKLSFFLSFRKKSKQEQNIRAAKKVLMQKINFFKHVRKITIVKINRVLLMCAENRKKLKINYGKVDWGKQKLAIQSKFHALKAKKGSKRWLYSKSFIAPLYILVKISCPKSQKRLKTLTVQQIFYCPSLLSCNFFLNLNNGRTYNIK